MGHDELTNADRNTLNSDLLDAKISIETNLIAYRNCMESYINAMEDAIDRVKSHFSQNELNSVHEREKQAAMKKVSIFYYYNSMCLD